MKGVILAFLLFVFLAVAAEARNARFSEDMFRDDSKSPVISKDLRPSPGTLEEVFTKQASKQGIKPFEPNTQKLHIQTKAKPNKQPKPYKPRPPLDYPLYYDIGYDYMRDFPNDAKRDEMDYDSDFEIREESMLDEYKNENELVIRNDEEEDKLEASMLEESRNDYYSDSAPRDEELFEDVSQDELREELLRAVLQTDEFPYTGRNLNSRRNMRVDKFLKQNLQLSELTKQDALLRKVLHDNGMGKSDKKLLKLREKLLREELLRMEADEQQQKQKKVLKMI